MKKLGELGCSGPEARERLERLMRMGLGSLGTDESVPLNDHARGFLKDMASYLEANEFWEPTFGQVTYAQDLYDRYIL